MADASVKVSVAFDFTGMADAFRQVAENLDALQAALSPEAPAAAEEPAETPAEDPQGP